MKKYQLTPDDINLYWRGEIEVSIATSNQSKSDIKDELKVFNTICDLAVLALEFKQEMENEL